MDVVRGRLLAAQKGRYEGGSDGSRRRALEKPLRKRRRKEAV
tara:strand:- start:537 stop:662 length:126 start_codon:yes stop_codon:yes gene_type:complete